MSFQPSPPLAQQRIGIEKPIDIFRSKTLAKTILPTGQMLVEVGYVKEMLTDCPAPETTGEQPTTESIQRSFPSGPVRNLPSVLGHSNTSSNAMTTSFLSLIYRDS